MGTSGCLGPIFDTSVGRDYLYGVSHVTRNYGPLVKSPGEKSEMGAWSCNVVSKKFRVFCYPIYLQDPPETESS
jgi:hypothetical protein